MTSPNPRPGRESGLPVDAGALARLAGLLADPTRTTLLLALLDGRAWTMGELARQAGIGASTASEHLSRLVAAGLLAEERQGRHRYLRLADRQVARMIEDLAEHTRPAGPTSTTGPAVPLAPAPTPSSLRTVQIRRALAAGRTCYDHLAGRLGVAITDALVERELISLTDGVTLTPAGAAWLTSVDVDVEELRAARRPLIRTCLDWTERRPHVAGGVGVAIRTSFLAHGWIEPGRTPRVMVVTDRGRATLPGLLGADPSRWS